MQTVRVEQLAQLLRDTILESEAREQERIIKVIEGHKPSCECGSLYITVCYAHRLIALIKGEK